MTKNRMIKLAIQAIRKVMPGNGDRKMDEAHKKAYEEYLTVIRWLESMRE
jgi:hypothetical protein